MTERESQVSRVRGLDGLRAVAILLVLAFHAGVPGASGGFAGVDVFFVLSGFLITRLLLAEFEASAGVRLRNFWARRGLRLLPALAAAIVLSVGIVGVQVVALNFSTSTAMRTVTTVPFAIFYSTNLMRAAGFNGNGGLLAHTWSLSAEEQFYLLWPLVVLGVMRMWGRRRLLGVSGWLCALSMGASAAAILAGAPVGVVENLTVTRAYGMFLGCGIAAFGRASEQPRSSLGRATPLVPRAGFAALAAFSVFGDHSASWVYAGGLQAVTVATGALLVFVSSTQRGRLVARLEHPLLVWIGARSYGLYLYHYPIFLAVGARWARPTRLALGLLGTVLAAWASFRFIEQPFLRRRGRFATVKTAEE